MENRNSFLHRSSSESPGTSPYPCPNMNTDCSEICIDDIGLESSCCRLSGFRSGFCACDMMHRRECVSVAWTGVRDCYMYFPHRRRLKLPGLSGGYVSSGWARRMAETIAMSKGGRCAGQKLEDGYTLQPGTVGLLASAAVDAALRFFDPLGTILYSFCQHRNHL